MEDSKQKAKNFLETVLRYFEGDLESYEQYLTYMHESPKINQQRKGSMNHIKNTPSPTPNLVTSSTHTFNLTIPITLSIFAVADVYGKLYREYNGTKITGNLKFFFKSIPELTDKDTNKLLDSYRNGLVHHYLPKSNFKISYMPSLESTRLFYLENDYEVLCVKNLSTLVLKIAKHLNNSNKPINANNFKNLNTGIYEKEKNKQ
jgi:hypothetical protein